MVDITIYDNPKLVERVEAGQILEALPGAFATITSISPEVSEKNPSNVFGYVNGMLDATNLTVVPSYGDIIRVQRIIPVKCVDVHKAENLSDWTTDQNLQYLVIGEIDRESSRYFTSPGFVEGNLFLNVSELGDVRNQLVKFSVDRGSRDYVFTTPSGEEFSLSEILLNLQEVLHKVS